MYQNQLLKQFANRGKITKDDLLRTTLVGIAALAYALQKTPPKRGPQAAIPHSIRHRPRKERELRLRIVEAMTIRDKKRTMNKRGKEAGIDFLT